MSINLYPNNSLPHINNLVSPSNLEKRGVGGGGGVVLGDNCSEEGCRQTADWGADWSSYPTTNHWSLP